MHVRGVDAGARLVAEHRLEARLAAQHRHGHPVHVARDRGLRRVVVRMGVEPEDEQLPPGLHGVARDAADRPHRQTVVAAEHERQPAFAQDRVGLARKVARPGCDLGEMAGPAFGRTGMRERLPGGEVAEVDHVVTELPERPDDPRGAQHRRPHRAAGYAWRRPRPARPRIVIGRRREPPGDPGAGLDRFRHVPPLPGLWPRHNSRLWPRRLDNRRGLPDGDGHDAYTPHRPDLHYYLLALQLAGSRLLSSIREAIIRPVPDGVHAPSRPRRDVR